MEIKTKKCVQLPGSALKGRGLPAALLLPIPSFCWPEYDVMVKHGTQGGGHILRMMRKIKGAWVPGDHSIVLQVLGGLCLCEGRSKC